jgi:4-hydroxy-tetrahydrodipicolinate synthase
MLYDIPSRTGRKIASDTTVELVRANINIIAMKDASGDLVSAAHTKAVLRDELDLYSGDDSVLLAFMAIGAVGIVSVAAHWAAPEFAALVRCVEKGDWDQARELNERLAPSCSFESTELYPNPVPAKAALRALGMDVGQCRLPLGVSDKRCDEAAAMIVAGLQATRG